MNKDNYKENGYELVHKRYYELCDKHAIEWLDFNVEEFENCYTHTSIGGDVTNGMLLAAMNDPREMAELDESLVVVAEFLPCYFGRCESCGTMHPDEEKCECRVEEDETKKVEK
ncbi:TPA: hypothetical protein N2788_004571 [Vibrio parahaemolyticus]|uniref:hypothetical protein n=1 Tax=Vibrio sp. A1-1 TaxID=2912250 RepID=UPI001F262E0D|nr:hypothetical protein [Vibrio sp. A1-1]MCF7456259.1 hypothetical protein [Vibrio sp. A1-1]HCG5877500.1 hypothetical protein [Vibrio parahaemolyticus]HCM0932258.1 hypothetical protein [Vibrio parahaemolyticus]HCM1151417.1 hypothetical protein [Vibrio parahaemolyticus]